MNFRLPNIVSLFAARTISARWPFVAAITGSLIGANISFAQSQQPWRWSETVYWQYAQEPLPQTAVGFAGTRRVLGGRWWGFHLEAGALAIMGHERQLAVCSASGCDDRQIGPLATATAQLIVGTPGRHLYSLLGFGGYVGAWGTGSASGMGPRGGLVDIGLGGRLAQVKVEVRPSGFGNTNYGNAQAITFGLGIIQ